MKYDIRPVRPATLIRRLTNIDPLQAIIYQRRRLRPPSLAMRLER